MLQKIVYGLNYNSSGTIYSKMPNVSRLLNLPNVDLRFRQLKAEEERKRRQREEEKRKAEEASAKLAEKNEETDSVVENIQVGTSNDNNHSSSGSVNGNTSRSDFTKNENNTPSTFQTIDNIAPTSLKVDERESEKLHEHPGKVIIVAEI